VYSALYGDYDLHYCGFEDKDNCGYVIESCSSSSAECWYKGSGRQNVYSGPIEDHTYGALNGNTQHYPILYTIFYDILHNLILFFIQYSMTYFTTLSYSLYNIL